MQQALRVQHVVTAIRLASTASKRRPPPPPSATRSKQPAATPLKPFQVESAKFKVPSNFNPSPQAPPSTTSPTAPIATTSPFARGRALPWVLAALLAGATGYYTVSLYIAATGPCHDPYIALLSHQKDVSARYDETADSFDSEVGISESLMGVNRIRKRLARHCKGHVLEVSCGTGRNLGFFDLGEGSAVESLTFVDLSKEMVEVCKKKWSILYQAENQPSWFSNAQIKKNLVVRFLTGSALAEMPPSPHTKTEDGKPKEKKKYTTILQTMGLCSTPEPHRLLANIFQHLDTSDPGARILLLEHGRSYLPWLNHILDNSAEKHAEIHGCWFNRDIGEIVEDEAKKAGFEVSRIRRHDFGTTWVMELKASENLLNQKESGPVPEEQPEKVPAARRSWFSLN